MIGNRIRIERPVCRIRDGFINSRLRILYLHFSLVHEQLDTEFEVQTVCTFSMNLQSVKIPGYSQNTDMCMRLKMLKYWLSRRRFQRSRRHFSAFFKLYYESTRKTPRNPRKCTKASHQNLNFICHALIINFLSGCARI